MPRHSRHVGQGTSLSPPLPCPPFPLTSPLALKWLSPDAAPPVPWQRVVASNGTISSRGPGTDGAARQREMLAAEGVAVAAGRTGEMRVDFGTDGWFPAPGTIETGVPQPADEEDDEGDGDDPGNQDANGDDTAES